MKSPALFLLTALPLLAAEPKPVTLTFYVAGVECPSCAYSVNYAIEQLKPVASFTACLIRLESLSVSVSRSVRSI